MRIKLFFQLDNEVIEQQYRKGIISWIKHALQEYDNNLFHEIYKDNSKKTFSWAAILSKPTFQKEQIIMKDNYLSIIFSAYEYSEALHLYNSFIKQKFKKYPFNQNEITLINISMMPEKEIVSEIIKIKTISPIVCRNHNQDTLKDMYYAYDREEFQEYIRINIQEQLKKENLDEELLKNFKIILVKAKKIVLPVYEKMIECSIGTFELQGNSRLLNYLYKSGIRK